MSEQTETDASLYVLGLLSPDDALMFEAALGADPELAALVADLQHAASAVMIEIIPERYPPAGLRARIMTQVHAELPAEDHEYQTPRLTSGVARPRHHWFPWALAAAFAILASLLGYQRYQLSLRVDNFLARTTDQQLELDRVQSQNLDLQHRLADSQVALTAAQETIANLSNRADSLQSQVAALRANNHFAELKIAALTSALGSAPQAGAIVAWDAATQRGIVKTLNFPAIRPDQDYQLWVIDPDYKAPVSAGVFNPAQSPQFHPLRPISKADKFAISLEKKGGSTSSAGPQGPIVVIGG